MKEPSPMPAAWCAARRTEIQAYVDGDGHRTAQETRTYLIELLAQLKQLDYGISDLHIELKDKPFIEFQLAELIAENRKSHNTELHHTYDAYKAMQRAAIQAQNNACDMITAANAGLALCEKRAKEQGYPSLFTL